MYQLYVIILFFTKCSHELWTHLHTLKDTDKFTLIAVTSALLNSQYYTWRSIYYLYFRFFCFLCKVHGMKLAKQDSPKEFRSFSLWTKLPEGLINACITSRFTALFKKLKGGWDGLVGIGGCQYSVFHIFPLSMGKLIASRSFLLHNLKFRYPSFTHWGSHTGTHGKV